MSLESDEKGVPAHTKCPRRVIERSAGARVRGTLGRPKDDTVRANLYARLRLLKKTALEEDPGDVEDTEDAIKHAQTLLRELFKHKPDLQPPRLFSFPGLVSLEWANASITTSRKILHFSHIDERRFTMSPSEMSEFVARVCKEDLKERITRVI